MSANDYERVWRETNEEAEQIRDRSKRDIEWCRIFDRKVNQLNRNGANS